MNVIFITFLKKYGSFLKKLNTISQPTLSFATLRDDPSKGSQVGNTLPLPDSKGRVFPFVLTQTDSPSLSLMLH